MTQQAQPDQQPIYVLFSAEVNPNTTEVLLATCADLANKGAKAIHLLLSTPGGSVMHGINIYNILRGLPFRLTTHNVGSVNSVGNVVFLAGDERYAVPDSTFMFHGVGFDVPQGSRLEEKLLRERLDSIQADQNQIASIIRDRASFPDEQEIASLFLQAATKDVAYARGHGIIHEIRNLDIPFGATVIPLVFQR